jgi:glycosyltransferase involved in cell wall biosynthesis
MNHNSKPLITIITVVYNSERLIEQTILSVLNQTYPNIEFIIIDGKSKDNTIEIIKKYEPRLAFWISEPDKGLYDAMNKGLLKAMGDYVCFLNSGDKFYSNDTLEKAFSNLNVLPDILYGETMIVGVGGEEIGLRRLKAPENLTWKSFKDGMLVCHQSFYVRRELAESYNINYKIASDFDWILRILKKAQSIYNTKLILTRFLDGGLNKSNIPRALIERFSIMAKHYGLFPTIFRHLIIGAKFWRFFLKHKRF